MWKIATVRWWVGMTKFGSVFWFSELSDSPPAAWGDSLAVPFYCSPAAVPIPHPEFRRYLASCIAFFPPILLPTVLASLHWMGHLNYLAFQGRLGRWFSRLSHGHVAMQSDQKVVDQVVPPVGHRDQLLKGNCHRGGHHQFSGREELLHCVIKVEHVRVAHRQGD